MWRTHKAANRPWPVISQDPVIDYMIMEAVALKVREEERKAEEKREREAFKQNKSKLNKHR